MQPIYLASRASLSTLQRSRACPCLLTRDSPGVSFPLLRSYDDQLGRRLVEPG